jgi:hypothetical protein
MFLPQLFTRHNFAARSNLVLCVYRTRSPPGKRSTQVGLTLGKPWPTHGLGVPAPHQDRRTASAPLSGTMGAQELIARALWAVQLVKAEKRDF